ncbi:hypothetical protein ABW20_dc0102863 [Dactylellina cionopaga]|nr:hypothetical protein ABW20_dc0102863 [Dactylellina cionopaga]
MSRHLLSGEEIRLGEEMAERLLDFAYGGGFIRQEEAVHVDGEGGIVVWGPNGNTTVVKFDKYDETMRKGRGKLLRALGWENCEKVAYAIQFGIKQ